MLQHCLKIKDMFESTLPKLSIDLPQGIFALKLVVNDFD